MLLGTKPELTIEERLKNIEQATIKELHAGIGDLLAKKSNQALVAGIAAGTIVAALIGDKRPLLALAAGLGSSLLVSMIVAHVLVPPTLANSA